MGLFSIRQRGGNLLFLTHSYQTGRLFVFVILFVQTNLEVPKSLQVLELRKHQILEFFCSHIEIGNKGFKVINLSKISLDDNLHVNVFLSPSLYVSRYYLFKPFKHGIKLVKCSVDSYLSFVHDSEINGIYYI